jgi:hypothetical protein
MQGPPGMISRPPGAPHWKTQMVWQRGPALAADSGAGLANACAAPNPRLAATATKNAAFRRMLVVIEVPPFEVRRTDAIVSRGDGSIKHAAGW